MGYSYYDNISRSSRALSKGYYTKSADEIFTQNALRRAHDTMLPRGIKLRESCDSKEHPNTIPIILTLDVTGSMRKIPKELIKDGLPTMMSTLIKAGIDDASVLFLAIGDHINDSYPLQVGQFESGDVELDLWLTRTFLEGRGGANNGESYLLSWYFAAFHTRTDAFDKRGQKGILFTIGDEPCLENLPKRTIEELMGNSVGKGYTAIELLELAKQKYDVYHLHVLEGEKGIKSMDYWTNLLGQNCIPVDDFKTIPHIISNIVIDNSQTKNTSKLNTNTIKDEPQIIL